MSKVLLFGGTIIGRALKTPVSPDPHAPQQSPEDVAAGAGTDIVLTIAPGSETIKSGEMRVHVPQLDAGSMLQGQEVDIVIAPVGHLSDTTKALQDLQETNNSLNTENNTLAQELATAQEHANSLQQQLQTMTERAEAAEQTVQERDTTIQALRKQVVDLQETPATPVMPQEPEVTATVVDDKVVPITGTASGTPTTPATPATPVTPVLPTPPATPGS